MASTLNQIMNIGVRSVNNNQVALNVVSNNISNINTEGYTRQQVNFAAIPAYDCFNWCSSSGKLLIGQGAEITGITNKRAEWLDNYFRGQNSASGYYDQLGPMADNLENLLNDELSSDGLQAKLSSFFSASQALSGDPTNNAYKIAFISAAQDISDMLNSMSKKVNGYMTQAIGTFGDADSFANSMIVTKTDELNAKLEELAKVNQSIAYDSTEGSYSADLADQKDAILNELSAMIPLQTTTNANGTVNIIIDGQTVVQGAEKKMDIVAVQTDDPDNPVKMQILDKEGNVRIDNANDAFNESGIGGILAAGSSEIFGYKSVLNDLDQLASAFAEEMNRIQTEVIDGKTPLYIGPDGTLEPSTTPIFVTKDGSGTFNAGNISINTALVKDPSLVATARIDTTQPDCDNRAVGNTGNMDLFNNLASGKLVGLSQTVPAGEGVSLTDFLSNLVSKVGSEVSEIKSAQTAQDAVTDQAKSEIDAMYGVDLNEELADLIKYQRAYEASARIFNMANELMQLIIGLGQ